MKYGLIGQKLSHSFSKEIHEKLADYTYELCEIEPNELEAFFKERSFNAINVTMPYKKAVIPFLDEISEVANQLQAVNTIVNRDGRLYGYNTDYQGLKDMIVRSNIALRDKKVLILGTGATSRTSSLVAKDLGASEIVLVSRNESYESVTYENAHKLHSDAQIIINATPAGMYPNYSPTLIDIEVFENLEAVFDAVYNPLRTELVNIARGCKAYSEGGLYMLVSQAVHAVEYFLNTKIDGQKTNDIFNSILKQKENIVLIGMPSSGKTTVGSILARDLDRELVDLDEEIEKYIGCTIAEFFEDHSEKEFRDIESYITSEVSKRNGLVIATGGGCVMKSRNVNFLRSNGRLYFLDRGLSSLTPTYSRPLARRPGDLENLYKLRYGIYLSTADVKIDGNLTPQEEADLIREEFYLPR